MWTYITLVKPPEPYDTILNAISGNRQSFKPLEFIGFYLGGHWSFDMCVEEKLVQYPDLGELPCYGVCDSPKQFLDRYRELGDRKEKYVVSFVELKREDEPSDGGWRWHKWGEYIGDQNPQHEYLYHDTHIDVVYTFHVNQILDQDNDL